MIGSFGRIALIRTASGAQVLPLCFLFKQHAVDAQIKIVFAKLVDLLPNTED